MKKILIVSNMYPNSKNPSYGVFVKRFCDQLTTLQYAYDLCVMHKTQNRIAKFFSYFIFYLKSFFLPLFGNYSVVYVHYASHSSITLFYAWKIRKFKLIVNVHGSDVVPESSKQLLMQKYTVRILHAAERIVVPSEYFRGYVANKYDIMTDKIYVYPSAGVNEKVFFPAQSNCEKDEIRDYFKLKQDSVIVAYVGRISPQKGWKTFVTSIFQLIDKNRDFQCVMVGNGKEEHELQEMIDKYNLGNNIIRYPLLAEDELSRLYRAIDFMVFPTEREGESLGLVALEAMASGCIVIASNFAAPKDYICNGINGFTYEVGNSNALTIQVLNCLSLDEKRKCEIVNHAIETSTRYNTSASLKKLDLILADLCK